MATLVYNGYTGLSNVRIDEWQTTPVYEVDGISHSMNQHRISGTALISGANLSNFDTTLTQAHALLTRPRGAFTLTLDGRSHINVSSPDAADGPFGNFRIGEPLTPLSTLVTFDITYFEYDLDTSETKGDVLAHRWTQEWTIGADGMQTHTAAGSLRIIPSATTTPLTAVNTGSNPDAYRQLVVPELPPGFRRDRMSFAIDETGNRVLYTIEDKEYGRDLPKPAKIASGSFRWERSMDTKFGMLGIKVFECELTAPPDVSPKDLLAAAVDVSKTKIVYSGEKPDLIRSIRVSEPDIFNQNKIGYRVVALGASIKAGERGQNISPPNFVLYQDLIEAANLTGYEDLPVYAHAAIRSLRRTLFTVTDANLSTDAEHVAKVPKAKWEQDDSYGHIVTTTVIAPDSVFTGADPTIAPGEDTAAEIHQDDPYIYYNSKDRIEVEDTGMVLLRSSGKLVNDVAVQLSKPLAFLITDVEMSRLGKAPGRPMRPLPVGSIVKADVFRVSVGNIDANNKRLYTAVYRRVVQLAQFEGASSYLVGLGPVRFWPAGAAGSMEMPIDQRISNNSPQNNIFVSGFHPFPVGPPEDYVVA